MNGRFEVHRVAITLASWILLNCAAGCGSNSPQQFPDRPTLPPQEPPEVTTKEIPEPQSP